MMSADRPNISMKRWLHSTRRDEPSYRHKPLRHVVERSVKLPLLLLQPFLGVPALPRHLPHDEQQREADRKRQQEGAGDHRLGLGAPFGEHARYGSRYDNDDGIALEAGSRADPLLAVDRARHAQRAQAALGGDAAHQRRILEVLADHCRILRIARDQLAVIVKQRDRRPLAEDDGGEEFLETCRIDAARQDAEESAVRSPLSRLAITVVHSRVNMLSTGSNSTADGSALAFNVLK